MTDNTNNTTPNFDDLSRGELVDLIVSANNQVTDLTDAVDNLRQGIVERDLNVVKLKDCIRAVVGKFTSKLVDGEDVKIDDWDALQEYFEEFEDIADLNAPVREVAFSVTLSTVVSGKMFVTDPNLDESDAEVRLIDQMDLFQNVDFLPDSCDGIDDIETDNYYLDFEVEDSSFDWND